MAIHDVVGHDRVKRILQAEVSGGTATGSYLFSGPEGVGKSAMAREFARALLCPVGGDDACDGCPSCLNVGKENHPDLTVLRPEGAFIKIEHLRALTRELLYRPFGGARRVAVLENADKMRAEAANAMLKTLEEPPADTVIVLVTSHSEALLDTIRSRCRKIPFGRLSRYQVEQSLAGRRDLAREDVALLARICEGSLQTALALDLEGYREDRDALLALLDAGGEQAGYAEGMKLVKRGKGRPAEQLKLLLKIYYGLVRDMAILWAGGGPDRVANVDIADALERIHRHWPMETCHTLAGEIQRALDDIDRFANKHLVLSDLFNRTARLRRR